MDSEHLRPYIKKEVTLNFARSDLRFALSQSLFSSHQIDTGTRHLLKTLEDLDPQRTRKVLDLGCGYGPLGLAIARIAPTAEVQLIDRDALAVAFADHNAALNGLANTRAYGSLGYDDVSDHDFDLIVSNIPGKAGETVIRSLLLDARHHLTPEGFVAIVIVNPLDAMVLATLERAGIEILRHETLSAHTLVHYRFSTTDDTGTGSEGWKSGIYDRASITFLLDELTVPMKTVRGLPEFDTLSYETVLAYKALQDLALDHYPRIAVFNPRQGLLPIVLLRRFQPDHVTLAGRDLLALRASAFNLGDNGVAEADIGQYHQVPLLPPSASPDLVVGILREDEGPDEIEAELVRAADHLDPGTEMLVIGGSTPVTRVLKSKAIDRAYRAVKRRRGKGNSTAVLQRR